MAQIPSGPETTDTEQAHGKLTLASKSRGALIGGTTNDPEGIQKMKSAEEGLLFLGSWLSLSIVSFGLPSLISSSSFWIWASE